MWRTWVVRFPAMKFTLSVRSFQVPATPFTSAWPPSFPSVPTSRATRVTSEARELSWSTIVLMVFFSSEISPRTSTVIFRARSPRATAGVTSARLRAWLVSVRAAERGGCGEGGGFGVAGERGGGGEVGRQAGRCRGQGIQLVDHRSGSVFQLEYCAAHVHGDFTGEIALGHRGGDFGDISHLVGEVAGHGIHTIGKVAPGSGDAAHFCLTAEFPFGSNFAAHAGHFH